MFDVKSGSSCDDNQIQQSTIDDYSTFQKTILEGSENDIKKMINDGANLAEKTKNGYNIVKLVNKRPDKNLRIKQLIICEYNKMEYLRELLKIDRELIKEIAKSFNKIMTLFQNKMFFKKKRLYSLYNENFYNDCPDLITNKSVQEDEYELILHFQHISQCIRLLNRHEGSIKEQYKYLINWYVLQGIEEGLRSHSLWDKDPGKLFESISPDCFRLHQFFSDVCNNLDAFDMQHGNIKRLTFKVKKCECSVLNDYVMAVYDKCLAQRSIDIIDVIKTLTNLNQKNEQLVMFHCIQLIGEISHSFSHSVFEQLHTFNFHRLKTFRDEIKNHWENTIRATYLLENIETNIYEKDLKDIQHILIEFYQPLLNGIISKKNQDLSNLLQEQSKQEIKVVTSSFKKLLETKPKDTRDPASTDITYVMRQIELLHQCVRHIYDILDECKQNQPDECSIRSQLQMPKIHYRCLLFLTIIGSTVQNMRVKHVFIATVPVELHEKLDYLRWIRNSLMHYDIHFRSNFYRNTLFDYLSNDLLIEEYSIDLHGQVMLQFEQFFKKLENELNEYRTVLSTLSLDNYYTKYSHCDEKFYKKDIQRKEGKVTDFLSRLKNMSALWRNNPPALKLSDIMQINACSDIKRCCLEHDFQILGIFGPLAKYGSTRNHSPSGFLVKTISNKYDTSFYDNLSKLKQFIVNFRLLKNICVVEVGQMQEYISHKYGKDVDISVLEAESSKYSLERLSNGEDLWYEITSYIDNKEICHDLQASIDRLLEKKGDICYEYRGSFQTFPILHQLCHAIFDVGRYPVEMLHYFRSIMERILNDGAQINIQDFYDETILHYLASIKGTNQISLDHLLPPTYHALFDTDITNRNDKSIPLSIAIINNVCPLKYELGRLTNLHQHANDLINAAVEGYDLQFLMYMTHVLRDTMDHYRTLTGIYRPNGKSLITGLMDESLDQNREICINMMKFLIENNVELSSTEYENLLLYLLMNSYNDLVLSLFRREIYVDFMDSGGNCPIHVALNKLINCKIQSERESHLEVLKKIVQNSSYLNYELHAGGDVPLYIAAKDGELDVVKLLLEQTGKVNINYKSYRYSHTMCCNAPQNEFEIIILLLEHGLPTTVWETFDDIKNDRLRSYLERCDKMFHGYRKNKNNMRNDIFKVLREDPDLRRLLVNRRDESGKNLLYYAIRESDIEFIKLILEHERSSVNLATNYTFKLEWSCDPLFYKNYIHHLLLCATGEVMTLFVEHDCIEWKSINVMDMEELTERAIKQNDQVLFQLIEKNGYPIISFQFRKHLMVRSYVKAFNSLESPPEYPSRRLIKELPNQRVLFQNKRRSNYFTLLSVAVRTNKLSTVKFLIEELNYNIYASSYSSSYKAKISVLDDFIISGKDNLEMLQYLMDKQVDIYDITNLYHIAFLSEHMRSRFYTYIDKNEKIHEVIFKSVTEHDLNNKKLVEFLLSLHKWDPDQYDDFGYAPLHHCAEKSYNDTIRLLCDSNRVDVELPTQNGIIFFTTGSRTPVGLALEAKNFEGARLLIQKYNASPYEYLLVLLIDALRNHDADYVKLLLQKSVIVDFEQTQFFLRDYANGSLKEQDNIISFTVLEQAIMYLRESNHQLEIPDFIIKTLEKCYEVRKSIN